MICECPLGKSLTDIPISDCPENVGQIQKVAFQIIDETSKFADSEITELESWQMKLVSSKKDKIILSPYIQAPTTEGGEAITFGGGNETLDGLPVMVGAQPTTFNGVLRSIAQKVVQELKKIECYRVGVYLFNQNGQIIHLHDNVKNEDMPIPIQSLFISDKVFGGFEAPDSNNISWQFPEGWSDKLKVTTPKFNPLTDLVNDKSPHNVSKVNDGGTPNQGQETTTGGKSRGKAIENK